MGFIHDIRRVIGQLPSKRQTLLFSATMPEEIRGLADGILRDPVRVAATPVATPAEAGAHRPHYVEKPEKIDLLKHLLDGPSVRNALVFARTKHGADKITRQLARYDVRVEAIHGNKSQNARNKALGNFKMGRTRVLVATDIAARGLDIPDLSHVINFDLPNEPESYVHRIGRTGRAGASGIALSFCSFEERPFLAGIERLIRKHLPVAEAHPFRSNRNPGPPAVLDPRRANGIPVLPMARADEPFRPGRSRRESKWGAGSESRKQGNREAEHRRRTR